MGAVEVDFILEIVIDGYFQARYLVYLVHPFLKRLAMTPIFASQCPQGIEQVRVDHFVQQSLLEFVVGPKLQNGLGQGDS